MRSEIWDAVIGCDALPIFLYNWLALHVHRPISAMFVRTSMSSPSSSTTSSSSLSPIHHASLVDPATHNPALLELIDVKVSRQVIEYVVDRVVETVDFAMGRPTPSSSSRRGRSAARRPEHAKFTTFVSNVLTRAEVTMPTLLASLVYVDRARPHLHIGLEQWALERVFLGALIVASKYLNDSTLKNLHWALCTGVFGKRDVGRIEREYLDVLNFELKVTEDDLLSHHEGLSEVVTLSPRPTRPMEIEIEIEMEESASPVVHRHTERRHPARRRTAAAAPAPAPAPVPELLSPSSGESSPDSDSSSFYSPQTPPDASMASPEDAKRASSHHHHHQHHKHVALHPTLPHAQQQPPTTARKMINAVTHGSTMDVLRLFPIPRMSTA